MIYDYPHIPKTIDIVKCLSLCVGEAFFMSVFNSHRSYALGDKIGYNSVYYESTEMHSM